MIKITRCVHIDAPLERVFDLMTDPAARAGLDPHVESIRAETEDGRRLHLGSRCHYRLQLADRIVDYNAEVTAFEEGRLIASDTDSEPPLHVTVETLPEEGGTLLRQTECFEASDALLDHAARGGFRANFLRFAYRVALLMDVDLAAAYRAQRERLLSERLNERLERLLGNVKRYLEGGGSLVNSSQ